MKPTDTATLLTVILNYQTAAMTLRAAERAMAAMAGIAGEILIVDNDSQDGSFEAMSAHVANKKWDSARPSVRVAQSGKNGGYGAGNNFGIRTGFSSGSTPDFIYILNPDAFPEKQAIRILMNHLETHPETGLAGSYIYGEDGETHLTTFRFPSIASEFEGAIQFGPISRLFKSRCVRIETPDQTQTVDWLAGASLMVRRSIFDKIGYFDEKFFLYFEETDLCRRATQAGWRTEFVPDSRVEHIGSVSTGMNTWHHVPNYWFDSRLHYFVKNHGAIYATIATFTHLTGGFIHWTRCRITGKRYGMTNGFLTALAAHDSKALLRAIFRRGKPENPGYDQQSAG